MLEKVMQKTWKVMPTWRQNGFQNPSKKNEKIIQKNITKNDAKMKCQKAIGPEGARARSAGRGKEFLWRLQVKVSLLHPTSSTKTNTRQTTKKQPRISGG